MHLKRTNKKNNIPQVPKPFLVLSPCAVEADRSVKALLYDGPATTECLHFTENLKCSIARVRGHSVNTVFPHLQGVIV